MTATINNAIEGSRIRSLIRDRVNAIRARNIDQSTAACDKDLTLFDVVGPLYYAGGDVARNRAAEWFSSFQGPLGFEMRDLTIEAGDDVAFSYSLNRVTATLVDGNKLDMWWRATVGYRKINGDWKVTHEHNSVPFDVETGKAVLDLTP